MLLRVLDRCTMSSTRFEMSVESRNRYQHTKILSMLRLIDIKKEVGWLSTLATRFEHSPRELSASIFHGLAG